MDDGTVENEICPVFVARLATEPSPNPDEVGALSWVPLAELSGLVGEDPGRLSPWAQEQLPQLSTLLLAT
jgi:isopentenyl-diphosphate delta-isomerase